LLVAALAALSVALLVLFTSGPSHRRSNRRPRHLPNRAVANPGGDYPVPSPGQEADVSRPDHIVGNGTPQSCTSAELVRDVAAGGVIAFDCGDRPVTITMSATAEVRRGVRLVVIDGGGLVTLNGGGRRRILFSDTCALPNWGDCASQAYPRIVVQNITFENGFDGTPQATCTADVPSCGYGGVAGGGAIYVEGGQFKAIDSRFVDNRCYGSGPDLGGGAIRALLQYDDRPVYIVHDSFIAGECSNGGALSSISVNWEIIDSRFTDNRAVGTGANPAAPGTPGGGSGGAIYLDGRNDSVLIAGTTMSGNHANEGGGALFDVVDTGTGTATFVKSHLQDNVSGAFETSPGVFFQVDQRDRIAKSIYSTAD
jgi:hypothetical protein